MIRSRPFSRLAVASCLGLATLALRPDAGAAAADPRTWHVVVGGDGDGTPEAPLGRLADALLLAAAGDTILVGPGTYQERIEPPRGGTADAPLTIAARELLDRPVFTQPGRVATIAHPYLVLDGLILDGQYGLDDAVRIRSAATGLVLRRVEVRNTSRDCIDMQAPAGVLIEDSLVHHCLNAARGRTDAHGIVAGAARDLTIRRTDVHTFSGDAVQLDPGRSSPGWSNLRIEGCRFWLAPLTTETNGFAAGVVPGENAIDTKTPPTGPRASLSVVDTEVWGFGGGLIKNMAAFNIKERVDAHFDRVTVSSSHIAFRLRGGGDSGARVHVTNTVIHSVDTAVRYEDDIDVVRLHHVTLGHAVGRVFHAAQAKASALDVRNLLALGTGVPPEAGGGALAVDADAFVDAAAHDYRPTPDSPAVDAATPLPEITHDRLGVARPQGAASDVGAFEFCLSGCPPATPKALEARMP